MRRNDRIFKYVPWVVVLLLIGVLTPYAWADLYLNILAVNGSDVAREKEISQVLPKELTAEDILDTDGLRLEYDVETGAYMVSGTVALAPKESKTYKILIRDLWKFDEEQVGKVREQVEVSLKQLEGTEYYDVGKIKKQVLLQRLDFLLQEQARFADNIEKRMDTFRVYEQEMATLREHAGSIKYWRTKLPDTEDADVFYFIIELENPTDEPVMNNQKYYLPKEVTPEHFVDLQDFDIRYDSIKQKSYLIKEEELKPKEVKRYNIALIDVWNIKQKNLDNLKERAKYAYQYIEPTKYVENAKYLMGNIKKNFETIEGIQAREKSINEHISVYRRNVERFASTRKDVEALEELLEVIREELKRSKVENVLKKIRGLRTLVDIAKSIMKKPVDQVAWNIIMAILIFVGVVTIINFAIWGSRSKNIDEKEETKEEKKGS